MFREPVNAWGLLSGNNRTRRYLLLFCACLAAILLGVAGVQSYRVLAGPDRMADDNVKVPLAEKERAALRALLNQGQTLIRNFLLDSEPDTDRLRQQLDVLATQADATLRQMEQNGVLSSTDVAGMRGFWNNYLNQLRVPLGWSDSTRRKRALKFFTQDLPAARRPGQQFLNLQAATDTAQSDERLKTLYAARLRSLRWLLACIAGVILFAAAMVAILVFSARDLARRDARQVEEFARYKSELRQLSARLLAVQEAERKSLSRELHDEVGQILTALRVDLSLIPSATLGNDIQLRLSRAVSLAEEAIRTTRNIALLLRPSLLDDLGLEAALCAHAEDFSRRTGIECVVRVEGLRDNLPDDVKTCVYRVVQEALNNCQKHSSALHAEIQVTQTGAGLELVVADDGLGIDLSGSRTCGIGLIGMRERASSIGGSFEIQPARRGTRILLRLPLESTANNGSTPTDVERRFSGNAGRPVTIS